MTGRNYKNTKGIKGKGTVIDLPGFHIPVSAVKCHGDGVAVIVFHKQIAFSAVDAHTLRQIIRPNAQFPKKVGIERIRQLAGIPASDIPGVACLVAIM